MRLKANIYWMIFVILLSFFQLVIIGCDRGLMTTPNLVNMDEAEAHSAIIEAGLTVGTISSECSNTVNAGEVGRQEPAAGKRVEPGTAVNIFISDGLLCSVRIPDPMLRRWIRRAIKIDAGAPVSESALKSLKRLAASGYYTEPLGWKGVVNLEGIQYCSNLTYLDIGSNSITDISLLSGLINLKELWLTSNPISNLDALSGLTNLVFLQLGGLPISNIDALSGLTNLRELCLQYTSVVNMDALSGLPNLKEIVLYNTSSPNLDSLTGVSSLEVITLYDAQISNIDALSELTNLKELWLDGNLITNIEALSALSDIEILWMDDNSITNIDALSGLTNLFSLNLRNNAIEDITPLVDNPNICAPGKTTTIHLDNNPLNSESCDILIPELISRSRYDCIISHSCDTQVQGKGAKSALDSFHN